jgi:hypothetical protein
MAVQAAGVGFEPTNEHSPVAGFQDLVLVIEISLEPRATSKLNLVDGHRDAPIASPRENDTSTRRHSSSAAARARGSIRCHAGSELRRVDEPARVRDKQLRRREGERGVTVIDGECPCAVAAGGNVAAGVQ